MLAIETCSLNIDTDALIAHYYALIVWHSNQAVVKLRGFHDPELVEEISQEICLHILKRYPGYDENKSSLDTWVGSQIDFAIREWRRSVRPTGAKRDHNMPYFWTEEIAGSTVWQIRNYDWPEVLEHLTEREAQVVWYCIIEGMRVSDVAARLELSLEQVYCARVKALEKLKAELKGKSR